jgi:dihydroorotate dehydrogenase (NAD+) catalytic subunit
LINASGTMELFELAEVLGSSITEKPPVAAYVPKTVTLEPRVGNPAPRILETAGGMMNAIGLSGPGVQAFIEYELPHLLALPCPVIISIGGFSTSEYISLARELQQALDETVTGDWTARVGLELNISCPNVHSGCLSIGCDPHETTEVVTAVRKVWPGLLVVKLSPNVTDITTIGLVAAAAGADALAAVNTYKGLALDRHTLRPYLGNVTGGLSGPAIKPLALRAVYDLFRAVDVPIIGMGGVATVQDVLEFVACGAKVVAVGSAGFRDPCLIADLVERLEATLGARGLALGELVGLAHQSV